MPACSSCLPLLRIFALNKFGTPTFLHRPPFFFGELFIESSWLMTLFGRRAITLSPCVPFVVIVMNPHTILFFTAHLLFPCGTSSVHCWIVTSTPTQLKHFVFQQILLVPIANWHLLNLIYFYSGKFGTAEINSYFITKAFWFCKPSL